MGTLNPTGRVVRRNMTMELSDKEFRRLLDLVYVGNWVMNTLRGSQRIKY